MERVALRVVERVVGMVEQVTAAKLDSLDSRGCELLTVDFD
jgi:hypothetical protein